MSNNKNDYIDPLSTIIKLFIYSYKPIGSKISIKNNKITIQESGIFQSTVRTFYGDTKNDINIMFNPIIFACDIYLKNNNKNIYKYIFENSLMAFDKLKETYVGSEIIYTIDNLKTHVEQFLTNENYNLSNIISNIDTPAYKIKRSIFDNINNVWSDMRLQILFGYLNEIQNPETDEALNSLLNSLESYMDYIDISTSNIINTLK